MRYLMPFLTLKGPNEVDYDTGGLQSTAQAMPGAHSSPTVVWPSGRSLIVLLLIATPIAAIGRNSGYLVEGGVGVLLSTTVAGGMIIGCLLDTDTP